MDIHKLNIPDMFIVESDKFKDHRGWLQESYHLNKLLEHRIDITFVQDNLVYSKKDVLRGLHFQKKNSSQGKIYCFNHKKFKSIDP